jgi:hypothetical protein
LKSSFGWRFGRDFGFAFAFGFVPALFAMPQVCQKPDGQRNTLRTVS